MENREFERLLTEDLHHYEKHFSFEPDKIERIKKYTLFNENNSASMVQHVIQAVGTVLAGLLIGVSLLFLLLISEIIEFSEIENFAIFLFFFSAIYYVPAFFFIVKGSRIVGETLYVIGLLLNTGSFTLTLFVIPGSAFIFYILCLALVILPYIYLNAKGIKIILSLFFQVVTVLFIGKSLYEDFTDIIDSIQIICIILIVVQAVIFGCSYLGKNSEKRYYCLNPLKYNAFFYLFLYSFVLTFIKQEDLLFYTVVNILYFLISTGAMIVLVKKNIPVLKVISIIFWAAFIFYKYYDIFWTLFHKSILLIMLGILFYFAATLLALRWGVFKKDEK